MATPVTTRVPLDIGAIHFIGIGGIGMSGIAEIMHNLGYKVQGSDVSDSANVKRLRAMGIPIAVGHSADNLKDAHAVVYSSAVKPGNVEFDAARALSLPLVRRAEMLAEIMRLRSCVAIAGTNARPPPRRWWRRCWMPADWTPPWSTAASSTPMAPMHGWAPANGWWWKPMKATAPSCACRPPSRSSPMPIPITWIITAPSTICATPFSALSKMCPSTASRCCAWIIPKCRRWWAASPTGAMITYGFSPQADARAVNVSFSEGASHFEVVFTDRRKNVETRWNNLSLPMPGEHNVQNSLAAIVVARELGVGENLIRKALAGFKGVGRRFFQAGGMAGHRDHRRLRPQSLQDCRCPARGASGL